MADARNPGIPFDASLLNLPELGLAPISSSPPTTDELRSMVRCMDYTTLSGDDTNARVRELCVRAKAPLPGETVAAVCVYPVFVRTALSALEGSRVRVATVAAAFPHGLSPLPCRVEEVRAACDLGAQEVDIVIQRAKALGGEWSDLYREVRLFKDACGPGRLKVILATGELGDRETVYRASMTALMAGADFVKTSTGKEPVNATPEVAAVMLRSIVEYRQKTGLLAGFKPAGGIRNAEGAVPFLRLAVEALGPEYVQPETFRLGASALLDDVVAKLGVS